MTSKRPPRGATPDDSIDSADTRPLIPAAELRASIEDDRPTEIHQVELITSREQLITGLTIGEMIKNPKHQLSQVLGRLLDRAQADLPGAIVDENASLLLLHEFEFDRRVGYQLKLQLFDPDHQCVEVSAQVDQDGKAIRSGSLVSKLLVI